MTGKLTWTEANEMDFYDLLRCHENLVYEFDLQAEIAVAQWNATPAKQRSKVPPYRRAY